MHEFPLLLLLIFVFGLFFSNKNTILAETHATYLFDRIKTLSRKLSVLEIVSPSYYQLVVIEAKQVTFPLGPENTALKSVS